MENFDQEWMAEFQRQVKQNILYYPLDEEMTVVRNAYRLLRDELPPDRQALLDRYFYLTKQMEIAMVRTAYTQGILHGQKHPLP